MSQQVSQNSCNHYQVIDLKYNTHMYLSPEAKLLGSNKNHNFSAGPQFADPQLNLATNKSDKLETK